MTFLRHIFFHITLIVFAVVQANALETNSMTDFYYLSVNAKGIHTTVLLNDVPLVNLKDGSSIVTEVPVGGWLIPGLNTLNIIGRALPGSETITGEVSVSVFQHDNSFDFPTAKKTYAALNFPLETSDLNQTVESVKLEFQFKEPTKIRLWKDAQVIIELTEKDKAEIMDLVNQFGQSVINGDIENAIFLQQYKINDDSLSEGTDAEEIKHAVKANYGWLKSQKGIRLHPHNKEHLNFSLMGNEKVVKITEQSDNEIIRLESDELMFEIPVFVSKINGKWTIVR